MRPELVKVSQGWLEVVGALADRDQGKGSFEGVQLGPKSDRIYLPLSSAHVRFRFRPVNPRSADASPLVAAGECRPR